MTATRRSSATSSPHTRRSRFGSSSPVTRIRSIIPTRPRRSAGWARSPGVGGLVHHSDRGVQYLSIRYTERLAEADAVGSVGSRGDSYDNALAETFNGLYKAELIHRHEGPWRSVELATAEWVDFWNTRRLHEACGYLPPAEYEAAYHAKREVTAAA